MRLIRFAAALVIVRVLTGEDYGRFSFVYVYISFYEVFVHFGLNATLIREVTQAPGRTPQILGNALLFKVLLCIAAWPVMIGVIYLSNYPISVLNGVLLAGFQLFFSVRDIYEVAYKVNLKMITPTLWNTLKNTLALLMVMVVAWLRPSIHTFILAYLVSGLVGLSGFILFTRRFIRLDFRPDFQMIKHLISQSFPLLLSGYLTLIYYRIDVVMLSKMKTFLDVGYYSVAVRLTESLDVIAASVMVSLFPLISRYFKEDRSSFETTISRGFRVLLLLGLPISIGGTLVAPELTIFLFGTAYTPSSTTLGILLWYTCLTFLGRLLASVLIACGRQITDAWISFAQVIANIGLNLILIPHYSYNGAAAATIVGAFVGVAFTFFYAVRDPRIRLPIPWREGWQAAGVNLIFGAVFWAFLSATVLPVWIEMPIGIGIYTFLLWAFRIFHWHQVFDYFSQMRKPPILPMVPSNGESL